jgi:hypothetical protein
MAEDGKYPGWFERTKAKLTKGDIRLPFQQGDVRDTKRLGPGTKADEIRRGYDVLRGITKATEPKAKRQ